MGALARVEEALRESGSRRTGKMWTCPAHEDRDPSLSVSQDGDRVLLHCHVDCEPEAVVAAMGLEWKDLFDIPRAERRQVAAYPYTDEAGELLCEVVRYEPKDFRQRRPNGSGGYLWDLQGVRRVLYRLPAVIAGVAAGNRIYITEGEEDADALCEAGVVATTAPSSTWRPEYGECLRGAEVVIVQDRDEAGRKYAHIVLSSLEGIAKSVRIVEAKTGKDAADHLAAGHPVDDFVDVDLTEDRPQPHENLTDMGNARRFARQHADDARYCADERVWRIWDGRRWKIDDTEAVVRLAKETVISIYSEAQEERDDDTLRSDLGKHAASCESVSKLRAMIQLAQSEPEVVARTADFDTHLGLLNVQNGTLNLDTLELRPQQRSDLLTMIASAEYDPEARSDLWDRVIKRAVPDEEGRRFLQKAAGYMLLGEKREDVILLVHGPPASAKGTVQQAIASTLGEYAITAELDALAERHRAGGPRPELVRLRGSRMVSIYESSRRLKLDAALLKTLTGSDPVTARGLYTRPVTFIPQFVLVVASNRRPNLPEDDDAVWRRVRELPFRTQIPEDERDPAVRQKLTDPAISGAAILAWAVEGLRMLKEEGLAPPDIVRQATLDYRREMDSLAPFFDECCVFEPTAWTTNAALGAAVEGWASEMGEKPHSMKAVGARLRARGCSSYRKYAGRGWLGIGLLDVAERSEHVA